MLNDSGHRFLVHIVENHCQVRGVRVDTHPTDQLVYGQIFEQAGLVEDHLVRVGCEIRKDHHGVLLTRVNAGNFVEFAVFHRAHNLYVLLDPRG